ncbi:hypothetical protein EG68_08007 [Paragonimus skrjabini miyazakii]|uniref:Uncharacterized protein n=1 Tax=Paragonimus skrjabini miyazakii TaxID=59628 RepID=A0A8S9YL48_9TREM|nr:hypothetical protein EG68_08007 [Paragonimus skrjabini miyazakii]
MTVCLVRRVVGSSNLVTWNSARFISSQRILSTLARGNARPSDVYKQMIEEQTIKPDAVQLRIVQYFDNLSAQMDIYKRNARFPFYLLKQQVPRGIYLHGSVGCGKTMLMDIFYTTCSYKLKWRTHFHAFMRTIHERLHVARQAAPRNRPADPIPSVAWDVSNEFKLLCLDEFQVTDIADAMILKRLFENLFKYGAVVVATSNREPDELYKHGLQRVNFLPFIDLLKKQCLVLNLHSPIDYRHELMSTIDENEFNVYYVYEQTPDADSKLGKWFIKLAADDGHRMFFVCSCLIIASVSNSLLPN